MSTENKYRCHIHGRSEHAYEATGRRASSAYDAAMIAAKHFAETVEGLEEDDEFTIIVERDGVKPRAFTVEVEWTPTFFLHEEPMPERGLP